MFRSPLIDAAVVLIVVLLFLGPKRLPELGKGLGRGMREFKEGITGDSKEDETPSQLSSAPASPATSEPAARPAHESVPVEGRDSAERRSEPKS